MGSRFDRRSLLKYASVSGLASLATACLSQNAPTTASATASAGGVGGPATSAPQAEAVKLKIQSGWAGKDIFQTMFTNWAKSVDEMSGGRLTIDALPVNSVTNINTAIDAVSSGTLDGAHHVPAYYYGKDHALSLFGTGPMMGMNNVNWHAWYYYGGGQDLYSKLVQQKLKLNVVSFFCGPAGHNQPLGWFKEEITSPAQFQGMKFRTVGLATGIYQALGASVISVAGAEVASSLERGVIDAAEFNNPTSDAAYGLPDVRKIVMTQSYHQPSEMLVIDLNKAKYDGLPKDLQAILKWSAIAAASDGEWLMENLNSQDFAKQVAGGVRYIPAPQSIRDAQLKAWDTVIQTESANNPDFVAILKSQKAWADRIFPWASTIDIKTPDPVSFDARPKV